MSQDSYINHIENEVIYLHIFDKIAETKDKELALKYLAEWSKEAKDHNKQEAACYYLNNYILPTLNGADCKNRPMPRWVDETFFHVPQEPTTIPEFLKLFDANFVDCFNVRKNLPMDRKFYDPASSVTSWSEIIEDNKSNHRETFFCPNPIDGVAIGQGGSRRVDENVLRFPSCFCDFDDGDLMFQELRLMDSIEPSMTVQSGRGLHAYWFAEDELTKEEWVRIQMGIIAKFGSDQAIKNPSRLMRLPFSWHCKTEDLKFVTIRSFNFRRYGKNALFAAFPYAPPAVKKFQLSPNSDPMKPRDLHVPPLEVLAEGYRHPTLIKECARMYAKLPQEKARDARELLKEWYSRSCAPLKENWEREIDKYIDWVEQREFGSVISR